MRDRPSQKVGRSATMRPVTWQAAAPNAAESRFIRGRWSDPRVPVLPLPVVLVTTVLVWLGGD